MATDSDGMAKGLIVGFISGAVVGAVVGLLVAPKAGRELRAEIKEKAGDIVDEAQDYVKRARTKASDLVNEGRMRSEELVSDARKQARSLLGDAERIMTDARSKSTGGEPGRNA